MAQTFRVTMRSFMGGPECNSLARTPGGALTFPVLRRAGHLGPDLHIAEA
jgi:hypothetical protein